MTQFVAALADATLAGMSQFGPAPTGFTHIERAQPMLVCADAGIGAVSELLAPAGLCVVGVAPGAAIPGSHWGEPEAGLVADTLHVRPDTPLHSALHEAGHWLLMEPARRARLHTDAGGSADEENAVCLLQLILADALPPMSFVRMTLDMDAWGYSFRLGSTRAWYDRDADDARLALAARVDRFSLAAPVMERVREEIRGDAISRRCDPAPRPS